MNLLGHHGGCLWSCLHDPSNLGGGWGGPPQLLGNCYTRDLLLSPQTNGQENAQWGCFRPWPCHAANPFISLSLAASPGFFPEGEVWSPLLPDSSLSRVGHSPGLSSPPPSPGPSMQHLPPSGRTSSFGGGSSYSLTRMPSQFPLQSRLLLTHVRKELQRPAVPSATSFPWAGSTGAWLQSGRRVGKEGSAMGKEYQLVFKNVTWQMVSRGTVHKAGT